MVTSSFQWTVSKIDIMQRTKHCFSNSIYMYVNAISITFEIVEFTVNMSFKTAFNDYYIF